MLEFSTKKFRRSYELGRNIIIMSFRKVLSLVIMLAVSVLSFSPYAFAAAKKQAAAPAAGADFVGIVDRGEILNNHPNLNKVRQQLSEIARKKERTKPKQQQIKRQTRRKRHRQFSRREWSLHRKSRG